MVHLILSYRKKKKEIEIIGFQELVGQSTASWAKLHFARNESKVDKNKQLR